MDNLKYYECDKVVGYNNLIKVGKSYLHQQQWIYEWIIQFQNKKV